MNCISFDACISLYKPIPRSTPFGAIHRIDVNTRTGELPYGIPADNPFLDDPDALPTLYAYGIRMPYVGSKDTGDRITGCGFNFYCQTLIHIARVNNFSLVNIFFFVEKEKEEAEYLSVMLERSILKRSIFSSLALTMAGQSGRVLDVYSLTNVTVLVRFDAPLANYEL